MTRESRAKWLALATATLVVALSALFAALRNLSPLPARAPPPAAAPAAVAPAVDAARIAAGRAAFERMNCAMCHSIAGRGNPSHPLDGVASRHDRESLRAWTLGEGPAAAALGGVAAVKRRAAGDPDLDALLDYLQQLR